MILVNQQIRRDSMMLDLDGGMEDNYLTLPKILIPDTEEFFNVINECPNYKDFYKKVNLRVGSRIRLSNEYDDYIFGCNDKMRVVFGTIQEITLIRRDGRIFFKSNKEVLTRWSYGIGEIAEIIEY